MKTINKLFAVLAVGSLMASCAEQDVKVYNVDEPESIASTKYLLEYDNIKDYVDRAAYPNFKIACALGADDYNAKGIVYRVANRNFDEVTLGNAMKYASVVGNDGSMNFNTIKGFLDNAEAAGMSVYGHTLVWHAQQNKTWLNKLMADIEFDVDRIYDVEQLRYGDLDKYPFSLLGGYEPKIVDGVMTTTTPRKTYKYYLYENLPTEKGLTYTVVIRAWTDKANKLKIEINGKDHYIELTPEWKDCVIEFVADADVTSIVANPARSSAEYKYEYISISHFPINHRPQTDKEKADTLTVEMNRWIKGMMEACDGRVKAWDLVNEAISGGGNVNGYYDLQHAATGSSSDFFWQDYLGNEEFVPIAGKAARKYYAEYGGDPSELKLFANDYNLESDWDDNMKLKSLIYWVGVWNEHGATIDGLSSQMHISYYEDKAIMRSKADHVVKMLKLMAGSGLLVRISELDMGYVNIYGNDVNTIDMTAEQHQNMANYYRFIIQMYLNLIPKEQQYGICQWCLTDAPSNSGWRKNQPVGLWDLDWNRKVTYAGFCEALKAPAANTEDYFEFLEANGLTHYITPETEE